MGATGRLGGPLRYLRVAVRTGVANGSSGLSYIAHEIPESIPRIILMKANFCKLGRRSSQRGRPQQKPGEVFGPGLSREVRPCCSGRMPAPLAFIDNEWRRSIQLQLILELFADQARSTSRRRLARGTRFGPPRAQDWFRYFRSSVAVGASGSSGARAMKRSRWCLASSVRSSLT